MRGAQWLHANAYVEEAVNYMIRAQEGEQATRWVADSVEELVFRRGYHWMILRWMNALPEAYVDRYPVIRIQYAFALSFYPQYQEYEAQIYRLQQLLKNLEAQAHHDTREIDELRCAVEMQVAMSVALRDDGMRGGDLAAAWLARWPEAPLRRKGVMGNVLSFGHKTRGQIDMNGTGDGRTDPPVARAKRRLLCVELDGLPRGRAAPQTRKLLRRKACVHARTRAG